MALFLAIVGIALIVSAINNTFTDLGSQLKSDIIGQGGFIYWVAALVIIGMLGYIPGIRTPARWLLALIVIVFLLKNGTGFFSNLSSALSQGPQAPAASTTNVTAPAQGIPVNITGGVGSSSSGPGSAVGSALKAIPFIGGLFG